MDDTSELFALGGLLIDGNIAHLALIIATLDDRAETQRHTFLWITRFHQRPFLDAPSFSYGVPDTLGCSTGGPIFWPMNHCLFTFLALAGPPLGQRCALLTLPG